MGKTTPRRAQQRMSASSFSMAWSVVCSWRVLKDLPLHPAHRGRVRRGYRGRGSPARELKRVAVMRLDTRRHTCGVDDDQGLLTGLAAVVPVAADVLTEGPLDRGGPDRTLVGRRVPSALDDDHITLLHDAIDQT